MSRDVTIPQALWLRLRDPAHATAAAGEESLHGVGVKGTIYHIIS